MKSLRSFRSSIKRVHKRLLYALSALLVAISTSLTAYASPTFSNYSLSSSYSGQAAPVVAGGSFWYLESSGGVAAYIGSVTTTGTETHYDIRTLSGNSSLTLKSITTGPDGNVWFNGHVSTTVYVGKLDISAGTVTLYSTSMPTYGNYGPLVAGSDGNLWYYIKSANNNYSYLVYLNPSTGTDSVGQMFDTYVDFNSITSGPDGKLWLTDTYYKRIYCKNPTVSGIACTYNVPTPTSYPMSITSGPDGRLWFIDNFTDIVKLTTGGTFTKYTPATGVSPRLLVAGSDGAVWFTDADTTKKIGRITTSGSITEYTIPGSSVSNPSGLTLGPDAAIWFPYTDSVGAKIGRLVVTPDFSNYSLSSSYSGRAAPVVAGGSFWYLEASGGVTAYIGNVTTSGTETHYNIRTLSGYSSLTLKSITTGPDGNVWFNGLSGNRVYVGKLDISTGTVTAMYITTIPTYGNYGPLVSGSDGNLWYYVKSANNNYTYLVYVNPSTGTDAVGQTYDTFVDFTGITPGPDGKIWITDSYYKRVYYKNPAGSGGSYNVPTPTSYPMAITSGADGNLWFIDNFTKIVKLTTGGTFTKYTPATGVSPRLLVAGSDGAVWFTDADTTKKIGRITTSGSITEYTIPGSSVSNPSGLTLGPDAAIWFPYTDSVGAKIGRLGY